MRAHFERLMAFERWANAEILTSLRAEGEARALELLCHVLAAQILWAVRLGSARAPTRVWPGWTLAECAAIQVELDGLWQAHLARLDGAALGRKVRYVNSKGEPHESTVHDVLTHVALHGHYHRGQIASHLRSLGRTPPHLDFIHATRSGKLA